MCVTVAVQARAARGKPAVSRIDKTAGADPTKEVKNHNGGAVGIQDFNMAHCADFSNKSMYQPTDAAPCVGGRPTRLAVRVRLAEGARPDALFAVVGVEVGLG